jgi:hypothetical protein
LGVLSVVQAKAWNAVQYLILMHESSCQQNGSWGKSIVDLPS